MFQNLSKKIFQSLSETSRDLIPGIPLALISGSLVALFLTLLDVSTHVRTEHRWLIAFLPAAGLLIFALYKKYGQKAEAGNNLILEEIQYPQKNIDGRMAPLILFSTLLTHLFGGSAGREGTAVQMGGSIAAWLNKRFRIPETQQRNLLYMGMAAGFGAVFGTPFAGAIFAIEVVAIGALHYSRLLSCLAASWIGHIVCIAWGIHHTEYHIRPNIGASTSLISMLIPAGICFGLCAALFSRSTHSLKALWKKMFPRFPFLIPVAGGLLLILLSRLPGAEDYLGLGVYPSRSGGASIMSAFQTHGVDTFSWLWKLLFTAITLSAGFKGGEVTPLFFMGAALGNTLGTLAGVPTDLLAGLGFLAVFAGASNTPLACSIMGIELFGAEYALYFAGVCYLSYFSSGHKGIYRSQGIHRRKWRVRDPSGQ